MGAAEFNRWVTTKMAKNKVNASRLAARVGELSDGTTLNATSIRLIREGRRRTYNTELVERIADALGEDRGEACRVAGVWPSDLSEEDYRRFRAWASAMLNKPIMGT
jgi:hypothetical protein